MARSGERPLSLPRESRRTRVAGTPRDHGQSQLLLVKRNLAGDEHDGFIGRGAWDSGSPTVISSTRPTATRTLPKLLRVSTTLRCSMTHKREGSPPALMAKSTGSGPHRRWFCLRDPGSSPVNPQRRTQRSLSRALESPVVVAGLMVVGLTAVNAVRRMGGCRWWLGLGNDQSSPSKCHCDIPPPGSTDRPDNDD